MRLYTAIVLAAAMLFLPMASHGKSMLTDEELLLMEEMQQAGFSKDQIDQVISLKVSVRETTKKWSEQELSELDSRLKAHWQAMIKALASDDIDTAVTYFDRDMREIHRILLSATTPEQRDHLLKSLEDINMITVKGSNYAEYTVRMPKTRPIYHYSSELIFIRNDEGIWEIRSF
ncbi:MAG TPA: hypothetical protein PLR71_14625 [Deltaproteobacteria bacterium]|nr:hypothetical protein [Deltaproteobacteria bacterium]